MSHVEIVSLEDFYKLTKYNILEFMAMKDFYFHKEFSSIIHSIEYLDKVKKNLQNWS